MTASQIQLLNKLSPEFLAWFNDPQTLEEQRQMLVKCNMDPKAMFLAGAVLGWTKGLTVAQKKLADLI